MKPLLPDAPVRVRRALAVAVFVVVYAVIWAGMGELTGGHRFTSGLVWGAVAGAVTLVILMLVQRCSGRRMFR